jgi:hypothetical protein
MPDLPAIDREVAALKADLLKVSRRGKGAGVYAASSTARAPKGQKSSAGFAGAAELSAVECRLILPAGVWWFVEGTASSMKCRNCAVEYGDACTPGT